MKKTNKLFSVVLAIVLVFAMAIPAFAAGDGKITISKPVAGQTYTAYQMLTFTPVEGNAEAGIYKVAEGWAAFFAEGGAGADYFTVDANDGAVTLIDEENVDLPALAKAAVAYAKDNNVTVAGEATPTADAGGNVADVVFTGLALGYYAVDTTLGTVCALTNTNSDETVIEKNFVPSIDKVVKEDSNGEWGKVNDAEIGDTVNYKTTVTVKPGATKYIVHDKMEDGLTFKNDIAIEGLTLDTDYTVSTTCDDECTFEITFTQTYLDKITADTEVAITYSAVINDKAEIVTETNDNTTWLVYGDNNTSTEEATTKTLTYYFNLTKIDAESKAQLEGAEFTLSNAEGETMKFVAIEGGYRVATEDDTNTTETIVAGNVVIKGLDADTYTLKETKAPAGYNLLDDAITVTVSKATVGDTVTFEAVEEKVENSTGGLLPETGGIGTTIFYIVGALLVVGAAILLITKKRMSAEA